jgi:hypothetical protein
MNMISKSGGADEDIIVRIKKSQSYFLTIITHMEIETNLFKNQNKAT